LRPGGLLLDIRPAQQHPWVELVRGEAARPDVSAVRLGQVDDSYRHGTLACADAALRTMVEVGRFVRERAETFIFTYHFDSIATWRAYMAVHWITARLPSQLLAWAHDQPAGAGAVRVLRVVHAQRLRRV
jgi:hypothetical protein